MHSSKTSTVLGSSGESLASATSSFGKCVTNMALARSQRLVIQFCREKYFSWFQMVTYNFELHQQEHNTTHICCEGFNCCLKGPIESFHNFFITACDQF